MGGADMRGSTTSFAATQGHGRHRVFKVRCSRWKGFSVRGLGFSTPAIQFFYKTMMPAQLPPGLRAARARARTRTESRGHALVPAVDRVTPPLRAWTVFGYGLEDRDFQVYTQSALPSSVPAQRWSVRFCPFCSAENADGLRGGPINAAAGCLPCRRAARATRRRPACNCLRARRARRNRRRRAAQPTLPNRGVAAAAAASPGAAPVPLPLPPLPEPALAADSDSEPDTVSAASPVAASPPPAPAGPALRRCSPCARHRLVHLAAAKTIV